MNENPEIEGVLTLTESAAKQIKQIQDAEPQARDKHFRIFIEGIGCSGFQYGMGFDIQREGDIMQEFYGLSVVIDPDSAIFLRGAEIDFQDGPEGGVFLINNPNTPGCGSCGGNCSQ